MVETVVCLRDFIKAECFVHFWPSVCCDLDPFFNSETCSKCHVVLMASRFCASVAVLMYFKEVSCDLSGFDLL